ncbi:hypothetical protein LIER_15996 [Lithospermum erythrorhizon]|uniref:Uncharacterized protein n=1 Tax=Lithospermum erythrorhizon TaxID=34254 RepID=A0AAV3QA96_LITER
MFPKGLSQLLSMYQRILQGEGVTTRQSLEAEQVTTREEAGRLMLAKDPSQHIYEDTDGQASENSSSCGYKPNYLAPAMMTGITSLEEQMAALTRMVETVLEKVQHQDDSIAQISGRIADEEHRARAAEVALKQVEAPTTSKMGDGTTHGTTHLFPHDTSGSQSHQPSACLYKSCIGTSSTLSIEYFPEPSSSWQQELMIWSSTLLQTKGTFPLFLQPLIRRPNMSQGSQEKLPSSKRNKHMQ